MREDLKESVTSEKLYEQKIKEEEISKNNDYNIIDHNDEIITTVEKKSKELILADKREEVKAVVEQEAESFAAYLAGKRRLIPTCMHLKKPVVSQMCARQQRTPEPGFVRCKTISPRIIRN